MVMMKYVILSVMMDMIEKIRFILLIDVFGVNITMAIGDF